MNKREYDYLIKLKKIFGCNPILPTSGCNSKTFNLISPKTNHSFLLDISRHGIIELSKIKIQNRYGKTKWPLMRLDIGRRCHLNPDKSIVSGNHVHIFTNDEDDTCNLPWAYELSDLDSFKNIDTSNFMSVFCIFCNVCNINTDNVQGVL